MPFNVNEPGAISRAEKGSDGWSMLPKKGWTNHVQTKPSYKFQNRKKKLCKSTTMHDQSSVLIYDTVLAVRTLLALILIGCGCESPWSPT